MSWDEEKETFAERPDVPANQKITSTEWNEHVSDQKDHSSRHEETGSDSLGVFDLVGSLTGQGLERVGDSLQVLSSIWDGENITANVDNESVNTDKTSSDTPPIRAQSKSGYLEQRVADRQLQQVHYGGRPPQDTPLFTWHFDDGRVSQYEQRDVFADNNVVYGVAANPGLMGNEDEFSRGDGTYEDVMTWDQLIELNEDYNTEILNHGYEHESFDELDSDGIEDEVYQATASLLDNGIKPTNYVYAYGNLGGDVGPGVVSELYPFAFGTSYGLLNDVKAFEMPRMETDGSGSGGRTIKNVKDGIDNAMAGGVGLVLFGHTIINGTEEDEERWETSTEKIEEIIQYVRNQGGEWADGGTVETIRNSSNHPAQIGNSEMLLKISGAWLDVLMGDGSQGVTIKNDDGSNVLVIEEGSDVKWTSAGNHIISPTGDVHFETDALYRDQQGPTLESPDGSYYRLVVDDGGNLDTEVF